MVQFLEDMHLNCSIFCKENKKVKLLFCLFFIVVPRIWQSMIHIFYDRMQDFVQGFTLQCDLPSQGHYVVQPGSGSEDPDPCRFWIRGTGSQKNRIIGKPNDNF